MQIKKEKNRLNKYIIDEENVNTRLDKVIAILNKDISRTSIQRLLDKEMILVNGKKQKASYRVSLNDVIEVEEEEAEEINLKAQDIPLEIVYEDNDITY